MDESIFGNNETNSVNITGTESATENTENIAENKEFEVVENNSWDTAGTSSTAGGPKANPEPVPAPNTATNSAPNPVPNMGPNPGMGQNPNMGPNPGMGPNPNMGPNMAPNPGMMSGPNMQPVPPMPYPNQPYAPGFYPQNDEMTVKDWVLTLLLSFIPLVGLVLQILWAAESNPVKKSRKNWAIASLIWRVIFYVFSVLFSYLIFALIVEAFDLFF